MSEEERTHSERIPELVAEHEAGASAGGSSDSTSERRTNPVRELN
jgi:hypothetical protein